MSDMWPSPGAAVEGESTAVEPFYPVTCHHPLMSRRRLLIGGAAALAASVIWPRAAAATGDAGTAIVRQYASASDDPWIVSHAVRAMGGEFTLAGGRRAVDYLLETHLESVPVNDKRVLAFPLQVEVHPDMFLAEAMLEAGVPLEHPFTHQGSRHTVREVLDGARARFRPGRVGAEPNMLPWSVIAFASTTSPMRSRWTNGWNEPVDLDETVERSLRLLEEASLPLMQAMREGRPETSKAPVHDFTCAGTHMIYALILAMHAGYTGTDRLERTRRQVDLLVWRLTADIALIERFYAARAGQPGRYWYETDSKLKVLGHAEECLAFGMKRGVVSLTPAQQAEHRTAAASLRRLLGDIEKRNVAEAHGLNEDLFRQLIGDACHARRGLTFT
jgi:hypothetical protein